MSTRTVADARRSLKSTIEILQKKARTDLPTGVLSTKQEAEEGGFQQTTMTANKLLAPPYNPDKLFAIVENSQILPQCIDAMKNNIYGFGYDLNYIGDESETDLSEESKTEKKNILSFFKKVNEKQSFTALSSEIREDYEKTGNGYMEIIRDKTNNIVLFYRLDTRKVRLQEIQKLAQPYPVSLYRNGQQSLITVYKQFRRFALLVGKTANKQRVIWFKEFGDTRKMDKYTGEYEEDLKPGTKIKEEASEVIHFKIGNDTYGIPRWSGQVLVTLGMQAAEYVNYDLFGNQVVPPLAVLVSGGTLTMESVEDIQDILVQKRGIENFNKVLILEGESKGSITEKDAIKIELKELSQARKTDAMFSEYTNKGEGKVRSAFKFPPMILGKAESYSKSCYCEETETLTDSGWKYYYDISNEDKIATYNPVTEAIEFHFPIGGLRLFDHDGEMINFCNQNIDSLVTPNHDMWMGQSGSSKEILLWMKVHAELLLQVDCSMITTIPESNFKIKQFKINHTQIKKVPYTGKVYCFEVPNHLFVTRRNGKVAIQGNTADSSKRVAEEQVFVPERKIHDGIINTLIMPEFNTANWEMVTRGPRLISSENIAEVFTSFSTNGVFTINHGIKLANKLLGMDMPEYETTKPWANMPIALVLAYAKQGLLDIDELNIAIDSISNIIDDPNNTTDPKKALKLYTALNQFSNTLTGIQDEKEEELSKNKKVSEDEE